MTGGAVKQVAKISHNDGISGTIKRGTFFHDGKKVSGIDLTKLVDFDLSKPIRFDLDGDLDRMAREVAELMAAPLEIDLGPSAETMAENMSAIFAPKPLI